MRNDQWIVLIAGVAAIAGIVWYFFLSSRSSAVASPAERGVEVATIIVSGGYSPAEIHLRAGRPVRLVFDRRENNPCSDELVIPDLSVRRFLTPFASTTIDLAPMSPGSVDFQCGMGMLHGKLVIE